MFTTNLFLHKDGSQLLLLTSFGRNLVEKTHELSVGLRQSFGFINSIYVQHQFKTHFYDISEGHRRSSSVLPIQEMDIPQKC